MTVDVAGVTHIGLKRKENQDTFLAESLGNNGTALVCLAVADGMGGHQEGRQASLEAMATLRNRIEQMLDVGEPPNEAWASGLHQAAHERVSLIAGDGEVVGTTLTLALIRDRECVIGHVGDSRAYRYRNQRLELLTHDHTWEAYALENGIENPYGKALRQAIGVGDRIEAETKRLEIEEGDWLVVCSDGLYKMLPEETIAREVRRAKSSRVLCDRLLKLALKAGGRDNVAISVARCGAVRQPWWLGWFGKGRR